MGFGSGRITEGQISNPPGSYAVVETRVTRCGCVCINEIVKGKARVSAGAGDDTSLTNRCGECDGGNTDKSMGFVT